MFSPPHARRQSAFLFLITSSLLSIATADPNASCYFPGGDYAAGFFPCIAYDAAYSACCPAGWSCFSNALCIATTPSNSFPNLTYGAVKRAACTAPKWANDVCGSVCLDQENKQGSLIACGNDRFCCSHDFDVGKCTCANNNSSNAFPIRPGVFQTIIQVSDVTFTGTPSISIATTTANARTTATSGTGGVTTTPATSTLSTAVPTGTGTLEESGGNNNLGRTIGLAVGIPLGVLAIAGVLLYLFWWRKRGAAEEEGLMSEPYRGGGGAGYSDAGVGATAAAGSGAGTGAGAAALDNDLRENDPDGPTWGNDHDHGRRIGI